MLERTASASASGGGTTALWPTGTATRCAAEAMPGWGLAPNSHASRNATRNQAPGFLTSRRFCSASSALSVSCALLLSSSTAAWASFHGTPAADASRAVAVCSGVMGWSLMETSAEAGAGAASGWSLS